MKAIILAAGYATRLYPLTENKPKSLLLVKGKPIIEYILNKIEKCVEIDEIIIVTNAKFYGQFQEWKNDYLIKNGKKKLTILNDNTKDNETRLGAVGDINYAIKTKKIDDDILVIAGDNLFSFEILNFLDFFRQKRATVLAVYDTKNKETIANRLGNWIGDAITSKTTSFEEKPKEPKTTFAATACYVFSKKDLHFVEEALNKKKSENSGDFIKFILEKGKEVYGFLFSGYWYDIGTHEEYTLVNKEGTRL